MHAFYLTNYTLEAFYVSPILHIQRYQARVHKRCPIFVKVGIYLYGSWTLIYASLLISTFGRKNIEPFSIVLKVKQSGKKVNPVDPFNWLMFQAHCGVWPHHV